MSTHDALGVAEVDVRRELVPTLREQAAGAVAPPPLAQPALEAEEAEEPGLLRRFADAYRALDPRGIASGQPVFPLIALTLLATIGEWDNLAFLVLGPIIKIDMKFDFAFLFTLMTVLQLLNSGVGPVAGYLADRVSRVWMTRVGAVLRNVGAVATALAPVPGLIVGARAASGLGQGIEQPARLPLLADYYPENARVRVYSFMQMFAQLGPSVAIFIVIFAAFRAGVGWRPIMLFFGLLSTAVTVLLWFLRDPVRGAFERRAMGADEEQARQVQTPVSWSEAWRTASAIHTLRRLWVAAPFLTVAQFGLSGLLYFVLQARLATLLAKGGGGPGAGLVATPNFQYLSLAFPALAAAVAVGLSAPVADRLMRYKPAKIMVFMGAVLALQAVGTLLFLTSPWILPATILQWAVAAVGAVIIPAQYTLLAEVVPPRIRGQGMQSMSWFQLLGYLLLPVVGQFGDRYGAQAAAVALIPIFLIGAVVTGTAGATVAADMRAARAASVADLEAMSARARGAAKLVVCRDLDVTYDGAQVLFGVDFDVEEGDLVALLGTNGAGKSTLLRAICGMHQASNGAIFFDGADITHKPPHLNSRDGIVFVPGGRAIFPTLTVAENLRAAAWMYRKDAAYVAERVDDVHELFPVLAERAGEMAGNMSGGEQQMLALGQAFLMKPRLLMIDELSLGLAPSVVERLIDVVRRIHASGTTVILVEQSLNVAVTVASRAVFMDKGEIRFDGPTPALLGRTDLVRAVFLGGPGRAGSSRRASVQPVARTTGEQPQPVLAVRDVAVTFGGVRALSGVDLQVQEGEVVGIVGPNGAGKTTLFDVISGFVPPDEGHVEIAGQPADSLAPDLRARLGLARSFQTPRLFPSLTVRENVAAALDRDITPRGALLTAAWLPPARRAERRALRRADNLVELLGLGAFANKFVDELSTGSRRMAELACILATDPRIVLLDEPSSGLAQAETEMLAPTVHRLVRETGCGVLVIEHDIPLLTGMSDRLVAMEFGAILLEGEPQAVVNDPRILRSYLNASSSVVQRSGALAAALAGLGVVGERPAPPEGKE